MKALYLASGKRIWVAEEPLAAPVPPEKLELAEAAAPDDGDDRDGNAARDVAAAATVLAAHEFMRATQPLEAIVLQWVNGGISGCLGGKPIEDLADDDRFASATRRRGRRRARDRHFFEGAQLARVDAALDAAANDDTLVGKRPAAVPRFRALAPAAHDPPSRALDFVVALSTLVPRDKIIEKLGAKEEQENALTTDLPFYADLVRSLDARAALVEPDPISLKLRVKLADALGALAHWPAATDHAGARRELREPPHPEARARRARARHAETVKAKAAAFERARDEVLEEYELAVDGSRRHRERNRHDYDDDDRDDREANDALVVAGVVHAHAAAPSTSSRRRPRPSSPSPSRRTSANTGQGPQRAREGEVRLSAP
ncbi:hypothetical protein JL722_15147 [Aureococcus anophagefferens]|nr:hypothetical protein JL722_15147 [Aureococcus anophagefferens]